jgi:hypothetical protein
MCFSSFAQSNDKNEITYKYEIGKKYYILQYRANVRNGPSRNNEVIAILSLNDEIEILENTLTLEKINNVWSYWYKIKCGNIIGYTFGGNIAIESLIIDNNGIIDSFHFRSSSPVRWLDFDAHHDIYIYINNQRINTGMLYRYRFNRFNPSLPYKFYQPILNGFDHYFHNCKFIKNNDYILIELINYGKDNYIWKTVYRVDNSGRIDFLEWRDEYYDINNILRILDRVTKDGEWYSETSNGYGEEWTIIKNENVK